jgi:predicted alpha/beta-hydrolase family hydrolase
MSETAASQAITITVDDTHVVSGLLQGTEHAFACYVLAHGAGAGMRHKFMGSVADGLASRGVATLRYQFPYMEQGGKRPDRPALAQATVRAAVTTATQLVPALPLFAGGKSFGGRMTSQAQATAPLANVRGLVFLGFPLHPAGKLADARALHLAETRVPLLFLQGTRDALAELDLLVPVVAGLGERASLMLIEGADHAFHVPARSGRNDRQVLDDMLDRAVTWCKATLAAAP